MHGGRTIMNTVLTVPWDTEHLENTPEFGLLRPENNRVTGSVFGGSSCGRKITLDLARFWGTVNKKEINEVVCDRRNVTRKEADGGLVTRLEIIKEAG